MSRSEASAATSNVGSIMVSGYVYLHPSLGATPISDFNLTQGRVVVPRNARPTHPPLPGSNPPSPNPNLRSNPGEGRLHAQKLYTVLLPKVVCYQ